LLSNKLSNNNTKLIPYWQESNNKSSLLTRKLVHMTSRLQVKEPRGVTIQKPTIRTYRSKAHYMHWRLKVHGCLWFSSNICSRKKYLQWSRF